MDLILTGRPVTAREAFEIGLANRLVPPGTSREAAEALAAELAGFPQTCLRNDRMSVLDAEGLPEDEAIAVEYRYGIGSLGDAVEGAARFADGRASGTATSPTSEPGRPRRRAGDVDRTRFGPVGS